jgi:hypothetical protein
MSEKYSTTQGYAPGTWSDSDRQQCTSNAIYPDAFDDANASCADGQYHLNDLDQPSTHDGYIPTPIPVPTLVLMLNNASICHSDNELFLNHEVLVQISPQIDRMEPGEVTDCVGLFDPWILAITPPSSHLNVLSRIVSMLVSQGKVPLEFVGFNSERDDLYRKK